LNPTPVEIPTEYRDLLEKKGFAHATTIGPKGEPQSQPVWYDWDGAHFLLTHTKARQKYRNLGRDPRISLSIQDPDNPYRYLEVRGIVEIVEDPEKRLIDELSLKYKGEHWPHSRPGEERVILKVTPTYAVGADVS
jgi:PPOX class probable F420-dependent enzyme